MSTASRKLSAVVLSALFAFSVLAGGVGTTGVAAVSANTASNAAGNASLSTLQTAGNQVANYDVTATYPSVGPGVDTVRLNFSGTGADFGYANAYVKNREVSVTGLSSPISVDSTSVASGGEALDVTLANSIPAGSPVTISFTVRSVRNPDTVGTNYATVDLRDQGSTTTRASESVSIVEGGDIVGSVTDADDGSALTDNSVTVDLFDASSGERVTGYGVNPKTGDYVATVPAGTYDVNVTADGYARSSKTATVTDGGQVTADVALGTGGWVNGTVTNGTGSPVSGLAVSAIREGSGDFAKKTTTAADGSYSLALDPATSSYEIYAGGGTSDYGFDLVRGVAVTKDATTTVNLTTPEKPESGTLSVTVRDPGGNAISGATVYSRSADFAYGGVAQTSKSGVATFSEPAGNYTLRIETPGYGTETIRGVAITASETTSRTVSLSTPAYINGTVTDTDGSPAANTQVLVSNGDQFYPNQTNANGEFNVTVEAGDYSVSVFAQGKSAPAKSVSVDARTVGTADLKLRTASIKHSDVSIVSGPGDDSNLGVRTNLQSGLMQLQLVDESSYSGSGVGEPDNLTSLGVTNTTEFEMNLTVTNFDPNSLIWGLRNADWETSPNESVKNGTDITITGSTVNMQAVDIRSNGVGPLLFRSPSQVNWPADRAAAADVGFTRTVYFGLFDLSTIPGAAQNNLNGISTTTNAQRFAPPTYENGTLRVWMAAPSTTVGGADHTGFYQATIPDSQLDAWGVDDPENELRVSYKDKPRSFEVTETADGARILLENISYSASYAEIEPDESAIQESRNADKSPSSPNDFEPTNSVPVSHPVLRTTAVGDGSGTAVATALSVARTQRVDVKFPAVAVSSPDGTPIGNSAVTAVNVTADTDISVFSVSATPTNASANGLPPVADQQDAIALGYVEISASASEENISVATVTMTLSESAREAAEITPENVTVYRYHDGWQALDTTAVGNGSYRAESPGFSVFAIGGIRQVNSSGETASDVTETPTAGPSTPATTDPSTPGTPDSSTPDGTDSASVATQTDSMTESETRGTPTTSGSGPGFGVVGTLVALLATTLLARRR